MNILNKVTLKLLGKNKTRTAVTIVGIILSAAMITAVTTGVSSFHKLMVNIMISANGDWYGSAYSVNNEKLDFVDKDDKVTEYSYLANIGYAKLEKPQNEYKPYLLIAGMSDNFDKMHPVYVTNGRMPKDSSEIIVPESVYSEAGVKFTLNQTLKLAIGERVDENGKLNQTERFTDSEKITSETIKCYTVVGFYERASFEHPMAPGYTALTIDDNNAKSNYDIFLKTENPKDIYNYMENNFSGYETGVNQDLLRALLSSDDDVLYTMLYGIAAVLIILIVFGSISLIYNAFSMSVSERTKQFGLLSSIGATKKQLLKSVLFEALFLSGIGIPIGILSGMGGLAVTFKLTEGLLSSLSTNNDKMSVKLTLSVTWVAIVAAIAIGLVTVLISAFLPARRATKMSAIEAIRQSNDIKIRGKKVRTSKLIYKLFGFEGMISSKNFKRNRRKYRATVISLFMSVVLFITASSFTAYLNKTTEIYLDDIDFDIAYECKDKTVKADEMNKTLSSVNGVTKSGYSKDIYAHGLIPVDSIDNNALKILKESRFTIESEKYLEFGCTYSFVDENSFRDFAKLNKLDADEYLNSSGPKAIAIDLIRMDTTSADGKTKRYQFNILNKDLKQLSVTETKENIDGYSFFGEKINDNGDISYVYRKDSGEMKNVTKAEALIERKINIGAVTQKKAFTNLDYGSSIILVYPYSAYDKVMYGNYQSYIQENELSFFYKADNPKEVYKNMVELLNQNNLATNDLINYAEIIEANRSLILLINVFSYGFIVLISLIAMANVFNTISTNIALRRREFAMLKSVGMTKHGFNRMINFECLLYGLKGIIYGLPVSFGLTYLIYKSVSEGWNASYFVPWQSVLIAVVSVFIVVFSTMLYSMRKINKENPIDALKNENI